MSQAGTAPAAVGSAVAELETPALTIDLDRLEANLDRAASYAAARGIGMHPHAKTHKTAEIASLQLARGAAGITVAKSSEAATFARVGLGPLLAHYPPVGAPKVERLVEVATWTRLTVALDSLEAAEPLARALGAAGLEAEALVELDVGMGRTGLDPAGAVRLAVAIQKLGGGLRVNGISCYPGHVRGDDAAVEAGLATVAARLGEAIDLFSGAGIPCERISGGSTRTLFDSHLTPVTEIRPGNYAVLDRGEAGGPGPYSLEDCALRVQATVISAAVPGRVVLDCGSKTLSEAGPPPGLAGFGVAPELPGLAIESLNEEHAVARTDGGTEPKVGDRIELIPNHACTCVNLHERLFAHRGGIVEAVFPVIARGTLQ